MRIKSGLVNRLSGEVLTAARFDRTPFDELRAGTEVRGRSHNQGSHFRQVYIAGCAAEADCCGVGGVWWMPAPRRANRQTK
jgi:hypothetical protein